MSHYDVDDPCMRERNVVSVNCYGSYVTEHIHTFPTRFVKCAQSKIELFKCRREHEH